jgi:hypothetical protein
VVVLAVDVARHAATDGDELGAGRDRWEPAPRQEEPNDLGEAEPRLAAEPPGRGVEGQDAVGRGGIEHEVALGGGQRGVAVGAPEAARGEPRAVGGQREPLGARDAAAAHRVASPPRERPDLAHRAHGGHRARRLTAPTASRG